MKIEVPGNITGKALIKYLVDNKVDLIRIAKSSIKETDKFCLHAIPDTSVLKTAFKGAPKATETDKIERTIVGNTYGWMDSHDDVHIDGIFTKSISENGSKVLHLHDHVQQLIAKVGRPKRVYEQSIKWADLNVDKPGNTVALLMDSEILKSYNEMIFNDYADGLIDQHSVGMIYVQLFLCVNDPEYKEEYANWNKYINYVGNREKAESKGYFWAVTEAKLVEISCVISGSNELTPTLDAKTDTSNQPPSGTEEQPSEKSSIITVTELFKLN
jgi:hypothetical protein